MFKAFIDQSFDRQVEDLKSLIAIPSVSRGAPEPGMPLGRPMHEALERAFEIAGGLGLAEHRSLDGYCGLIDYGRGEEMLMIMAHLDVVPAGTGWTGDPFRPEVIDGRVVGRGAIDNKGPAVSAIYALAAVKNAGIPLRRRVRILLGCDEEAGWKCIERYKQSEPEPTLAFTPDGDYPLVHSEMGICHASYFKPLSGSALRIDCGTAANVVPGEAEARLPFEPLPVKAPAGFVISGGDGRLRALGRGGHAAHPGDSKNAMQALLFALAAQPLEGEDLAAAAALHALLGFDEHGEGFRLDRRDESGRLSLAPTMLSWNEDGVHITLDARYPFSIGEETLAGALDAAFGAIGFERRTLECKAGHFIDPGSELVSTLMDVYEKHIGHKASPRAIGGGTYARAFKNAVAFGADPEGAVSECHMPDESIALSDIRFNTLVMAEAIARLAG
ncbi:MAG: Sapep family Mn(2+)-dependent dipeptidase [Clostridia bacterium]|nr:Sapep family Mn(2+)-dependent dipeptidase [Clostridia bacterium]